MAGEMRQRMIDGAVRLLAIRGPQATSFTEVLEATGAPRGSVYHHFPDGKDQMVAAAVDRAGEYATSAIDALEGRPAADVTQAFLDLWRSVLTRSDLRAGCAVLAVTVTTDSPDLLAHAAGVFRGWRGRLATVLVSGGLEPTAAERFAALLVASTEGAVVLARAEQSLEPFELVAAQLMDQVRELAG